MRLAIDHTTTYTFGDPVATALQQVRLAPANSATQTVSSWKMDIDGGETQVSYQDQHANLVHLVRATPGTTVLTIRCEGEINTHGQGAAVNEHFGLTPLWLFRRQTALTEPGDAVRELASKFDETLTYDVAAAHELSAAVRAAVDYEVGATTSLITAEDALASGAGVCQDHAQIFVSAARLLGTPARYVSGYLMMDDRVEQDATHAWAEAWITGLGWVGFDVSNVISPDDRYVHIAKGLDYRDAAPIVGIRTGSGGEHLDVTVNVQQ